MKFEADAAVDRAMDLFWLQGYAATTPQQLADELGIAKGSLYNTFESKHALFTRALRRYSEMRLAYLTELFDGPGPVRPRIQQAVTVLCGLGEHRRGCVVVNAAAELGTSDADVTGIADDLFDKIEAVFRRAVEQGQRSGELDPTRSAASAASQIVATVIGLSVLVKARGASRRPATVIADLVASL